MTVNFLFPETLSVVSFFVSLFWGPPLCALLLKLFLVITSVRTSSVPAAWISRCVPGDSHMALGGLLWVAGTQCGGLLGGPVAGARCGMCATWGLTPANSVCSTVRPFTKHKTADLNTSN